MIELNDIEILECVQAGVANETILSVTFGVSIALSLLTFAKDSFYRNIGLISCVVGLFSFYELYKLKSKGSGPVEPV